MKLFVYLPVEIVVSDDVIMTCCHWAGRLWLEPTSAGKVLTDQSK